MGFNTPPSANQIPCNDGTTNVQAVLDGLTPGGGDPAPVVLGSSELPGGPTVDINDQVQLLWPALDADIVATDGTARITAAVDVWINVEATSSVLTADISDETKSLAVLLEEFAPVGQDVLTGPGLVSVGFASPFPALVDGAVVGALFNVRFGFLLLAGHGIEISAENSAGTGRLGAFAQVQAISASNVDLS